MKKLHDICAIEEIPDREARGFKLDIENESVDFFIIHKENNFYGYINRCPHTGVNLDWQPHQFLDLTGYQIQCSTHGALFRIRDGYCVRGPCMGRSLTPVELVQENGRLKLVKKNSLAKTGMGE